jgi:hypothetical protein
MKREDRVVLVASLVVFVLMTVWVYATNVATMAPHEEELWIQTCYPTTDVTTGVNITQIVTKNSGILYYAGHYDLDGGNYTVYSEGEPGWIYRKITKVEILAPT